MTQRRISPESASYELRGARVRVARKQTWCDYCNHISDPIEAGVIRPGDTYAALSNETRACARHINPADIVTPSAP